MAISSSKDFIVFPNDNSGRLYINEATFTASGTWTAPAGVTSAQVILVGAGGGGGGGSRDVAGGGGAGGQVITKNITVTPGTTYNVTIGAGGQGGQGAILSTADTTNTLPGNNGSATVFGNITIANLLVNADFDYNVQAWDTNTFFRAVTGVSGQSSLTVYPNANGLSAGQYVTGTNIGGNAQIVSISGNVITVSAANTGTVQVVGSFGLSEALVRPSNVFFYNISAAGSDITTNPQTGNTPGSPYFTNLSNNILQPEIAQLEEAAILTNNYIRQYGTALSSFSITNAGVPTKLAEMVGGYAKTATAPLTSTTVTLDSTLNVYPGMYITGTGFTAGTTILSVDSATQITISATTNQLLSGSAAVISYSGAFGINGLICGTSSSTSAGAPTWVQFSTMNSTTTSNATQTVANWQGVPYLPGQAYTFSAYISTNVNISTSTPILFQIRSAGASWNAISSTSYLGGTNSGTTNSIDAGQSNGFFVRQATPATLTNYGGSFATTGTASNGSTSLTVADATGILIGMAVTGSGIQTSTVVSGLTGTLVTLSLATNAPLSGTAVTFANPAGVQMLGSNVTVGQTGWRRLSATFTTPSIASALANGVYQWGSTPQFIHPVIVFQQPSVNFWIDNIQLECGNTTTTWRPPVYREAQTMLMWSNAATGANIETTHKFVKISPSTQYSGSAYVVATGSSNQYRPTRAFIEYFDADYNSLLRTEGNNVYLPISGQRNLDQQMPNVTYPVRVVVNGATSPVTAAYARFGILNYQGAQTGSAGQVEYNIIAPQLEPASVATIYKKVDNVSYFYAGQPGQTPIVSSLGTLAAEGGGGGGTYNTYNYHWQFGMEGGNNGGHAAVGGYNSQTNAGGGAGAGGVGGNAIGYGIANQTNSLDGHRGTAALSQQVWPMRGHQGGAAVVNASTYNQYLSYYAGNGGPGVLLSGLNSGSPLGLPLGGGGGGAGWSASNSTQQANPGQGQNGGGKGAPTWLYNANSDGGSDYYARGIDAIANTGAGGGGGASNWNNAPSTLVTHYTASRAVNYEALSSEYYKWNPIYNATTTIVGGSIMYSTNSLRVTIQDTGNAKVTTSWQQFPIMPRIALVFPGVAARLTTAPGGVTSAQFTGLPKRVRPTVRWKNDRNQIIREDRPGYDIQFAGTSTVTYLGPTGATSGYWQTLKAPANASFFDVCWEFLYMDAGDVVDVDFGGCQYYGYEAFGGNGADGFAMIRWFDKAVL